MLIIALLVGFSSCERFIDVELPSSQLNAKDVFKNKQTATAALSAIYSSIRETGLLTGYNSGLSSQLGLYSDELTFFGLPATGSANFYNNALLPSLSEIKSLWAASYLQIYSANAIVEGIDGSSAISQTDKDQIKGEALFIRAIVHFYLTNCYGNVPYITSTDYMQNKQVQRQQVQLVFQQIKEDLSASINLLPSAYPSSERVRPNKWAAQALFARVCLYMQQWKEAEDAATAVINQTALYQMPTDIQNTFLKGSTSTLWQLMPALAGDNTYEGQTFIFQTLSPTFAALTTELVNAFDPIDKRKQWIREVSNGANVWYHAYKYKQRANTGSSVEYSIMLRLAEQYLIRAEVRAKLGNIAGSQQDLNVIRNAAGLGNTLASTQETLLSEIYLQRRLEFFSELGHRFFDLKRNNLLNLTLQTTKPGWDNNDKFFPIPESEIILNNNLAPQNEGY